MNGEMMHKVRAMLRTMKVPGFAANDVGILVPEGLKTAGFFYHDVNGLDPQYDENLVVTEGRNHALDVIFHGAAQINPWYVALFAGNVTPLASWTAANFTANSSEYQGYDEATRVEYNEDAPAGGSINNLANKAAFTIGAAGATIYGAALISAAGKGATTGKLWCATLFANPRILVEDDVLNVGYTNNLTAS